MYISLSPPPPPPPPPPHLSLSLCYLRFILNLIAQPILLHETNVLIYTARPHIIMLLTLLTVRCMMYGFGDDQNPYSETVDLLEDLVIEFISEMVSR